MVEKRNFRRATISLDVVVKMPERESIILKTGNASQGGVFLLTGEYDFFEEGMTFELTLPELLKSDEPLTIRAQVKRKSDKGIGVEFIELVSPLPDK